MNSFFTLYQYEWKKICQRKLVWITMGVLILVSVFMTVGDAFSDHQSVTASKEQMTYQERMDKLLSYWKEQQLSEQEKAYWQAQEEKLEKPFIYGYAKGWFRMIEELFYLNFCMILGIAICLSTIFADEHMRGMDQLILCSKYGKKQLFLVKMAGGITLGTGGAILIFLSSLVTALGIYGTEGFNTMLQIYLPLCSRNLTVGQAVLSIAGMYVAASIVFGILTMFLSEVMKNSVAVMGVLIGGMILTTFFNIPPQYRALSQLYGLLVSLQQAGWYLMDNRLVNLFGIQLRNEDMVMILYPVISLVLLFWGNHIYQNYQVRGR